VKIEKGGRFEFVAVASARARQLLRGCTPRTDGSAKPARLAQLEVKRGKVEKSADDQKAGQSAAL
jgi:DNA-directed RNA polymerase subunit K/omega